MLYLFKTPLGRLRIICFLEGVSLLLLLFIAVPLKYFFQYPLAVRLVGPIHGLLFCLFIFMTLSIAVAQKWSFSQTTWKVLVACMLPFGSVYIDRQFLRPQSMLDDGKP
jgi:integral membrane protein